MDDGADLVNELHTRRTELLDGVVGGTEETTTGVIRLRAMAKAGKLAYPIVAVNEALTKHLFDNRYGTGQSAIDGILRATNILFAGKTVVVGGYGWVGRGIASRAHGHGLQRGRGRGGSDPRAGGGHGRLPGDERRRGRAQRRHLHQRHRQPERLGPRPLLGDARRGRPGQRRALQRRVRAWRARGAGTSSREVRPFTREYAMPDGRRLYVLADGRLVNLGAAEGHPAMVMDMSFANQALGLEWLRAHVAELEPQVYGIPDEIDREVARLKLLSMGIDIERVDAGAARLRGLLGVRHLGRVHSPAMSDSQRRIPFTSESVTEGHPDKLCDAVADAILDDVLANDATARAAIEVAATTGLVLVLGELTHRGLLRRAERGARHGARDRLRRQPPGLRLGDVRDASWPSRSSRRTSRWASTTRWRRKQGTEPTSSAPATRE